MKNCLSCATLNPDDVQFCSSCGARFGVPSPAITALTPGEARTSGKAIGSLISGFLFFIFPAAIVAVVLGHISLSEINRGRGRVRGRGMAIAGLILGYIGIAFIPLIIAAIAIPNLLRAKMAANESSAVGTLRMYNTAMVRYANACPQAGFPAGLENLGPGTGGGCDHAGILNGTLAGPQPMKSGYTFHYEVAQRNDAGQASMYTLNADPVTQGTTGVRHFFADQTGVIRWDIGAEADSSSTPLQ
jgi:type IV pilus assembly protein PilA